MAKTLTLIPEKPKTWLSLLAWGFLIVFAGKFVLVEALPYFGFDKEVYGRFWEMKWPLIGHITGGLLALVLGPFQFWVGFRNRYLKVHRWMGRLYMTGILIGTISSVALALTTGMAIHLSWAISLIVLAAAWFLTTGMALRFILLRRINLHKEWMVRSYVVTFAFVLFRWLNSTPYFVELGNFIERGPTMIWVSWVIPLLITEVILQWNKK
ncbi:DUF2306 domain-containing protein [Aquiflexum gelatinilyticum]|uniref:DUF2306 domain-containing protein n=1 Tax=Aquiflexum gelatinilyticum TaxID=2961943 RepID=A0A9X2SZS3_9BACT|nr:DUF2306 domain-containing protein [Aquiflexum gelatinilyticum]MCR9017087.1 DUF2306 domain-containing protein [Aquiflexum gelatinilyticum]